MSNISQFLGTSGCGAYVSPTDNFIKIGSTNGLLKLSTKHRFGDDSYPEGYYDTYYYLPIVCKDKNIIFPVYHKYDSTTYESKSISIYRYNVDTMEFTQYFINEYTYRVNAVGTIYTLNSSDNNYYFISFFTLYNSTYDVYKIITVKMDTNFSVLSTTETNVTSTEASLATSSRLVDYTNPSIPKIYAGYINGSTSIEIYWDNDTTYVSTTTKNGIVGDNTVRVIENDTDYFYNSNTVISRNFRVELRSLGASSDYADYFLISSKNDSSCYKGEYIGKLLYTFVPNTHDLATVILTPYGLLFATASYSSNTNRNLNFIQFI